MWGCEAGDEHKGLTKKWRWVWHRSISYAQTDNPRIVCAILGVDFAHAILGLSHELREVCISD